MRKQVAAHLRCPLCCVGQEICWKLFTCDFLFNPKVWMQALVNILNPRSGINKQSLAWSCVCELYIYEGALHQRAAEERENDVTSGWKGTGAGDLLNRFPSSLPGPSGFGSLTSDLGRCANNQNGNLRWHLPLGVRPTPPLNGKISRHFSTPLFFFCNWYNIKPRLWQGVRSGVQLSCTETRF